MNRKFAFLPVLALLVGACSPSLYSISVDMRQPSASGLDLGGKSMSVVYIDNHDASDSLYAAGAADGFASALEDSYFNGEESIGVYTMSSDLKSDYSQRDTLVKLVVQTGADVVFLIDHKSSCDTLSMYVYDSMDPDDVVMKYKAVNYNSMDGENVGARAAEKFLSQWKTEIMSLYYYDSEIWLNAAYDSMEMRWKSAVDKWMKCLNTSDVLKRSCAEYNIATACFMMSDYSLALEWLDASDKDNPLPLTPGLRQRIKNASRK